MYLKLNVFILLLCSGFSQAESSEQKLQSFLTKLSQMSGQFTQIIVSGNGSDIRSATGTFKIKKPGMFDWRYIEPYEQQIVSNGIKIWIYDEDLEQVSIRKISESLNSSPLSIFVSDTPVENIFSIENMDKNDDIDWVKLTPKGDASSFEFIEIGLYRGDLSKMILQDNFGQTTRLLFNHIGKHTPIDAADFQFKVPEGADVFEEQ
ncbi:MAG: outer membrane lipoprotein carrier protein LolA [Piscirickettsiaceae bacterium]|nr:MAG: outer membrane lipoprotein carrier protein LolA [Piscirickettsiaceae bacterium]